MGYLRNGADITALCDLSYASDTRTKAAINTHNYLFNGSKREISNPNAQFLTHAAGYVYSAEGLGGKYQKNGANLTAAAKGCRPATKHRWSSSSAGTYYINKFSDGELWVSTVDQSRTGTKIGEASEDIKYLFGVLGGAGGGGGKASLTASAGGGGGGGYAYLLFNISAGETNYCTIGSGGGSGDGGSANGGGGASLYLERIPSSQRFHYSVNGGVGGYAGGNNSGKGGDGGGIWQAGGWGDTSGTHEVMTKNGGAGGQRNNAGSGSTANFNCYTPEAQQVTYITGSGGSGGGSSGGGGGGGNPLGHGGAAVSGSAGSDGMICAGGGGGSYKAFNQLNGGSGGNGYIAFYY